MYSKLQCEFILRHSDQIIKKRLEFEYLLVFFHPFGVRLHRWTSMCCVHVSFRIVIIDDDYRCVFFHVVKVLWKWSFEVVTIAYKTSTSGNARTILLPVTAAHFCLTEINLRHLCYLRTENDNFNLIGLLDVAWYHDVRLLHITIDRKSIEKITFDRRSFNLNCFIIVFYKRIAWMQTKCFLIVQASSKWKTACEQDRGDTQFREMDAQNASVSLNRRQKHHINSNKHCEMSVLGTRYLYGVNSAWCLFVRCV